MANSFVFDDDPNQPNSGGLAPEPSGPEGNPPEGGEGRNRTFLIAAVVLGGIVLLTLVCMAIYGLFILPGIRASAKATSDANAAASTQAADIAAQTQLASQFTATLPPTDTPAPLPTETLVVVFASATPTTAITTDPVTSTAEALLTQLANSQSLGAGTKAASLAGTPGTTGTPGTPGTPKTPGTPGTPGTQTLAKTGLADEFGLPGLVIAFVIVLAVIMLSRRLRQSHQE